MPQIIIGRKLVRLCWVWFVLHGFPQRNHKAEPFKCFYALASSSNCRLVGINNNEGWHLGREKWIFPLTDLTGKCHDGCTAGMWVFRAHRREVRWVCKRFSLTCLNEHPLHFYLVPLTHLVYSRISVGSLLDISACVVFRKCCLENNNNKEKKLVMNVYQIANSKKCLSNSSLSREKDTRNEKYRRKNTTYLKPKKFSSHPQNRLLWKILCSWSTLILERSQFSLVRHIYYYKYLLYFWNERYQNLLFKTRFRSVKTVNICLD